MNTTMRTSLCRLAIILSTVLFASFGMINIHVTVVHLPAITIMANNNNNCTTTESLTRQLDHPELLKVLLRPYKNTTSNDLESDIWNRNNMIRFHQFKHNHIITIKFWELTTEEHYHYSLRQYMKHNYAIDLSGLQKLAYDNLPSLSDIQAVQDQWNSLASSGTMMFWRCSTIALFVLVVAFIVLLIVLIVLQSLCGLCLIASLLSFGVLQRDSLPVTFASFFILLHITSKGQRKLLLRDIGRILEVAWSIKKVLFGLFSIALPNVVALIFSSLMHTLQAIWNVLIGLIEAIIKVPSKIVEVITKVLFGIVGILGSAINVTVRSLLFITQAIIKALLSSLRRMMKVLADVVALIDRFLHFTKQVTIKVLSGVFPDRKTSDELENIDVYYDALEQLEEEASLTIESLVNQVFPENQDCDTGVFDAFDDYLVRLEADTTIEATTEVGSDLPAINHEDVVLPPIKTRYGRIIRKPSLYSDYYCCQRQRPSRRR